MRTENSRTFAEPDGATMMLETSTAPVFGHDADGDWSAIDTSLEQRGDGTVSPVSTAAQVQFPGRGDHRVVLDYHDRRLEWSVPGHLESPSIAGDTATYIDVFPGVDLRLTATAEGFRQVYVVKTPAAARLDAIKRLSFKTATGNGQLVANSSGGITFLDSNGDVTFESARPGMWDSSGDLAQGQMPVVDGRLPDGSPRKPGFRGPRDGDKFAAMKVDVGKQAVAVTPDARMLASDDTVFPVFIDPYMPIDRDERTMLRSDGVEAWQFDGSEGMGKCPRDYDYYCASYYTKRLFYEFGRETLNYGDKVLGAEFSALETWAATCTKTSVDLKQTNAISSGSAWPGPSVIRAIGSRMAAYGRTDCPSQAVEFNDPALVDAASDLASGSLSRLTLRLSATDETNQLAWKQFRQDGVLRVWYALKPDIPTGVGVHRNDWYTCNDYPSPLIVPEAQPEFRAIVQTLVQPAAGEPDGSLRAKFEMQQETTPGNWADISGFGAFRLRPANGDGFQPDGTPMILKLADIGVTLQGGEHYRMRALTQSHYDIPGIGVDELESGWSSNDLGWCHFMVDPDGPLPPVVKSKDNVYPDETSSGIITWGGGPGEPGKFDVAPDPDDNDPNIKSYAAALTSGEGTVTVTWPDASQSSVATATPSSWGPYLLTVSAKDIFDRPSVSTVHPFYVKPPREADGVWHVDEHDGTSVADTNGVQTQHPLAVTGGAAIVSKGMRGGLLDEATLLPADRALEFDGTWNGVTTDAPVLLTEAPLTVSAWVRLDNKSADRTVLSQESGDGNRGYVLGYQKSTDRWFFGWHYIDSAGLKWVRSTSTTPVTIGVWTHLVGIYDNEQQGLLLFVNGRPVSTTYASATGGATPQSTNSNFSVGRSRTAGQVGGYFDGVIDEIRVWNRAAGSAEIMDRATVDIDTNTRYTSLVGHWCANRWTGSGIPDSSAFGATQLSAAGTPTFDSGSKQVNLNEQGGTGDAVAATGPVVDETGSFTVQANVRMDPLGAATMQVGDRARVAGQRATAANGYSSWALWWVKKGTDTDGTPLGNWVFGRWARSGSSDPSPVTANGLTYSDVVRAGEMTRVAGVYDAREDRIHIFVGEDDRDSKSFTSPSQGSGDLSVGRAHTAVSTDWTDWLHGGLNELRIWTGAMTHTEFTTVDGGTSCN